MTKSALAATSLVAAVPSGFLAFLTVKAFLDHADKMGGMLQVVTGTALLVSGLMTLSPVAILLFGKRSPKAEDAAATAGVAASSAAAAEETVLVPSPKGSVDETSSEVDDAFGLEDFGADVAAEVEDSEPAESMDLDDDAFEFDDDEFK